MNHHDTKRAISIILSVSMTVMICGCPAAGPMQPENDTPPEIPPITTFSIDFNEFPQDDANELAQTDGMDMMGEMQPPGSYWTRSALGVGIWSTILTVVLAIPVGAFVESFNHEPTAQEDGRWLWTYSVNVNGSVHTAKLFGGTSRNAIEWTMLLSKEDEYTDFEWFNGSHNILGTEGVWTVFRSPNDPIPFLQIDWTRDPTNGTRDIRFTNITPDGPENGGFIYHAITNDPLDATYDIFNKGEDNLTAIQWSRETREGRIMDPNAFGDEDYRCWGGDLQNVDCE